MRATLNGRDSFRQYAAVVARFVAFEISDRSPSLQVVTLNMRLAQGSIVEIRANRGKATAAMCSDVLLWGSAISGGAGIG
jgi:hypothetical protein